MSQLDKATWSTCSGLGTQLKGADLLDNLIHQQKLEDLYCNNFICCGQYWTDLHTLLQHCEEHHSDSGMGDVHLSPVKDDEEEEQDEIQTPPSPIVAPHYLVNQDQNTLVKPHETQEEYGYEKIKEWIHQAQLDRAYEKEVQGAPLVTVENVIRISMG
ncbi:hypothetical protein BC941DRAFT_453530 [Chlamydoabsidia padenii]|nr:hypothetical protein BC941DRAFT_453530 [Chlamydoabsidia padenii]